MPVSATSGLEHTFYGRPILPMAGGADEDFSNVGSTPADLEFTVENDPVLNDLGLIDPKTGRPLPTADWSPDADRATPASGRDASAGAEPTDKWATPDNPFYQQVIQANHPVAQGRGYLQSKQAEVSAQYQSNVATLVANGVPQDGAQLVAGLAAKAQLAEARNEAEHIALGPRVREHVAADIAARYSTSGAKVEPAELLTEESPQAMEAIAKRIQRDRRDARASTRSASGTDRAEGGPSQGARIDYSKLTAQQAIKVGLARGQ